MKKLKQFTRFMKGEIHWYLFGLLLVFTLQYFRTLTPLFIQHVVDTIFGNDPSDLPAFIIPLLEGDTLRQSLLLVAIISVLFTLLRMTMIFLRRVIHARFSENVAERLRNKLYDHLQNLPYEYHSHAETGDLIQRVTTDVETYKAFVGDQLVEVIRMVSLLGFALFQMAQMSVMMTLISSIIAPLVFFLSFLYFSKVKTVFEKVEQSEGAMTTTVQESMTGIRVVKAFNNEIFEINRFEEKSKDFRDKVYKLIHLMAYFWGGTDFLIFGQYALTAGFGIFFVINGDLQTGQFIAFLSLLGLIVWPIRQLGRIIADFGKTTVSLDRIEEILSQTSEHENDAVNTPDIQGKITFEDVSFQFSDDTQHLLKNVTFEVLPGERVAIIGKTGSGKSTLLKLLLRLYDIDEGVIKIDGVPIQEINKKHLRKHIGMVLQEPFLYSRSVYENLSILNRNADSKKIESIANIASVHQDIKQFEKGYDTVVGERGVTLSGGQKQRLAIARMLLEHKPVLMFDDSLSAVDTETDRKIREALETTWKDATVFMITHRITTAMEADKIFVLEDGRIVQSGTHESLINEEGLYARLWKIQANIKLQTTNKEVR